MNKQQLENDLRAGLGRAYLDLKRATDIKIYQTQVEQVILKYTDYDIQSEGTRGIYFYNIISLYNNDEYFIDKMIEEIKNADNDNRLFEHLLAIIFQFAFFENVKARRFLQDYYQYIYNWISETRDLEAGVYYYQYNIYATLINYLINIYDIDYVHKIIIDIAALDKTFHALIDIEWICILMYERFSKSQIRKILKRYNINYQFPERIIDSGQDRISFERFLELARGKGPYMFGPASNFAEQATELELLELARIIINEPDLAVGSRLLKVFKFRIFPLDYSTLLPYFAIDEYRYDVTKVFIKMKAKALLTFAVNQLRQENDRCALLILASQLSKNNIDFFKEKLYSLDFNDDPDKDHFFLSDLADLIGGKKIVTNDLLIYIFHHLQCSFCRERVAEYIVKRKEKGDFITELLYDCNEAIREMANKSLLVK